MRLLICVLIIASSFFGLTFLGTPRIKADDLDQLTGPQWKGTLTYLDYGKNKRVSIPANLTVTKSTEDKPTWVFEFQYPDEPGANSKKKVHIGKDGRTIDDETIVERTTLADKTLKIVTEKSGPDNDNQAQVRFTYRLSATSFSIKKEVKHEGADEFFERNGYCWKR